jgi:hypothetical protein
MYKKFTENGNSIWINMLNELLNNYNNKIHSSTKRKPIDMYNKEIKLPSNDENIIKKSKAKFKIGDTVRINYKRGVFDKGYLPNWSFELFKIDEVLNTQPITYKIKDLENKNIKGSFYENEL